MRPAVLLLLLLPFIAGCPGRLEDPERFEGGATGPCTLDVERTLLPTSCGGGGCHGANAPAGKLDLESPGVAQRLVDITSECEGKPLVGAGSSYFLEKVHANPTCGAQMPVGTPLTEYERACLEQYVQELMAEATR